MLKFVISFFSITILLTVGAPPFASADSRECDTLLKKAAGTHLLPQKLELLKQAQAACPDDPESNFKYAYILERLRKYNQALGYYRKAVSLDPSSARYLFGRGDAARMAGKVREAVDSYRKGLELQPDNARIKKLLQKMEDKLASLPPEKEEEPESEKVKPSPPPPPEKKIIKRQLAIQAPNEKKIELVFPYMDSRDSEMKFFEELNEKKQQDNEDWH